MLLERLRRVAKAPTTLPMTGSTSRQSAVAVASSHVGSSSGSRYFLMIDCERISGSFGAPGSSARDDEEAAGPMLNGE